MKIKSMCVIELASPIKAYTDNMWDDSGRVTTSPETKKLLRNGWQPHGSPYYADGKHCVLMVKY